MPSVRIVKILLFAGMAFARVFKHSEAKWRQLPSLFSEALETGPTVYKNGTLVLISGRAFFCQSPVVSARPLARLSRMDLIQGGGKCDRFQEKRILCVSPRAGPAGPGPVRRSKRSLNFCTQVVFGALQLVQSGDSIVLKIF
jgi:hypothetical protein